MQVDLSPVLLPILTVLKGLVVIPQYPRLLSGLLTYWLNLSFEENARVILRPNPFFNSVKIVINFKKVEELMILVLLFN